MEKYTGKSIFKGIAIGKILFYQKGEQPVKRVKIEDTNVTRMHAQRQQSSYRDCMKKH